MKILLFPSDMGGGFGHISRCLALAYEAKSRGHECAFVINDWKYFSRIQSAFRVYTSMLYPKWSSALFNQAKALIRGFASDKQPVFTEFSSLDYQPLRDGFTNEKIVEKKLAQYQNIVHKFKPDLLVGDTNLLTWILSKLTDIPLIQIVRYANHPDTEKIIWWKNAPENMAPPNTVALFNRALAKKKLATITKISNLLQGDFYVVPSIPEIEPIIDKNKISYTGALTISNNNLEVPPWFSDLNNKRPLIYITIGGGAGPVGTKQFFMTILEAFRNSPFQVVVSTSMKFDLKSLPPSTNSVRFFNWVPGKLLISKADLVIFHGGYGTLMETVKYGKPTITIPFQTEQEGNGRRLECLGSGRVLKLSEEEPKIINGTWAYGNFSYLAQYSYDLKAETLIEESSKILTNTEHQEKAQKLQGEVQKYRGSYQLIELMENL